MSERHVDEMVDFLNEVLAVDADWLTRLIELRLPCSQQLADHPSVQVAHPLNAGVLGLLNGFCGVRDDARGWIVAIVANGKITKFVRNTV